MLIHKHPQRNVDYYLAYKRTFYMSIKCEQDMCDDSSAFALVHGHDFQSCL